MHGSKAVVGLTTIPFWIFVYLQEMVKFHKIWQIAEHFRQLVHPLMTASPSQSYITSNITVPYPAFIQLMSKIDIDGILVTQVHGRVAYLGGNCNK